MPCSELAEGWPDSPVGPGRTGQHCSTPSRGVRRVKAPPDGSYARRSAYVPTRKLAQPTVADPQVVCNLVEDRIADGQCQGRWIRIGSLEGTSKDRDLAWDRRSGRTPRGPRHTRVQPEQPVRPDAGELVRGRFVG